MTVRKAAEMVTKSLHFSSVHTSKVVSAESCIMNITGHKQQLQWFRNYIAAVLSTPGQQDFPPTYLLQVFDLRNKLIAISIPLTEVCPASMLSLLIPVHYMHNAYCHPCTHVPDTLVTPLQLSVPGSWYMLKFFGTGCLPCVDVCSTLQHLLDMLGRDSIYHRMLINTTWSCERWIG